MKSLDISECYKENFLFVIGSGEFECKDIQDIWMIARSQLSQVDGSMFKGERNPVKCTRIKMECSHVLENQEPETQQPEGDLAPQRCCPASGCQCSKKPAAEILLQLLYARQSQGEKERLRQWLGEEISSIINNTVYHLLYASYVQFFRLRKIQVGMNNRLESKHLKLLS